MSALTPAKRSEIEAELAKLEARLLKYETALDNVLDSGMKRYKLDTGEGSQSAEYLSPEDLQKSIDLINSQIATKKRILTGGNFRRMTLNRKTHIPDRNEDSGVV
jgi:hypothetical protein